MATFLSGAGRLEVRSMAVEDLPAIARIFRDAFNDLYARRGYGEAVADVSVGRSVAQTYQRLDPDGCLVVTAGGRVVGSGFLHPRGATAGAGPISVEPRAQRRGAGSALMRELCQRSDACGARSLRLIQDAFNEVSFALYGRLGFVARETLVRASLPPRRGSERPRGVRRADARDVAAIVASEESLLGIHRPQDHEFLLSVGEIFVVERDGAIAGSLARIVRGSAAVLGPATSEDLDILLALIARATADLPPSTDVRLLVPARLSRLLDELYERDLRIHSLCTYMVRGAYEPFRGYYVPTLLPESG